MIEIVVARYEENVDWLKSFDLPKTVYSKGRDGDLPNVGYEAQTYLHHFAVRYDSLSDVTICLQGDPYPHLPEPLAEVIHRIAPNNFSFLPIAKHARWQKRDGAPHHLGLGPTNERMWQALTGHCPPDLWHAWYGGQFAVHRNRILAKPQEFWRTAAELVRTKEEACAVERMWTFLFLGSK